MRERFFSGDREFPEQSSAIQYGDLTGSIVVKEIHAPDPVISGIYLYEDGGWTWEEPLQGPRPTAMDSSNNAKPPVC